METENRVSPNGAAAAAILSSAIGVCVLGALTAFSEVVASSRSLLVFYGAAGPISGRTTIAVLFWLAAWAWLHASWKERQVDFTRIFFWTLVLLAGGVIGTFPPPFEELGNLLRSTR